MHYSIKQEKIMSSMSRMTTLVFGISVGIFLCLAVVVGVGHYSPERQQQQVDTCVAQAVRTYPTLGGKEMVVKNLDACHNLDDDQLAGVRRDLQDFGIEAATRVAAGQ